MALEILEYVDRMGPGEFACWTAAILVLLFGTDYWRHFG